MNFSGWAIRTFDNTWSVLTRDIYNLTRISMLQLLPAISVISFQTAHLVSIRPVIGLESTIADALGHTKKAFMAY